MNEYYELYTQRISVRSSCFNFLSRRIVGDWKKRDSSTIARSCTVCCCCGVFINMAQLKTGRVRMMMMIMDFADSLVFLWSLCPVVHTAGRRRYTTATRLPSTDGNDGRKVRFEAPLFFVSSRPGMLMIIVSFMRSGNMNQHVCLNNNTRFCVECE
jgi:hypothetical protein